MNEIGKTKVVVLGAGVTGLSAAYRLSKNPKFEVHVIEKEALAGGICRSFNEGDFILDYGPHKFYTLLDGIVEELESLMGDDLLVRDKTQNLYMQGKYFSFPLKMSEMLLRFPPTKSAKVLSSFGKQIVANKFTRQEAKSYEDFIIERFGRGLFEEIFEPMAKKIYGAPQELDRKLAEVRISSPGLVAVMKQILLNRADRTVSAPTFHYPKLGYGMIPQRLKEGVEKNGGKIHLGAKITQIDVKAGRVSSIAMETANGEQLRLPCDFCVYTIPISALDNLISEGLPADIRQATRFVGYRHTVIHYYLLKSKPVLPAMWVFFPEKQFRFGRLSEMPKFSPHTAPEGHTSLMVDFTCEDNDPVWSMDDKDLGNMLYDQMQPLKLFGKEQVVKHFSRRFRNAYPIYSLGYQQNIEAIRRLEALYANLFFIGRLGDFNYNNADQCMDMGFAAADHIANASKMSSDWQQLRESRFAQYRIVD